MTNRGRGATQWWANLPTGRVTRLEGPTAELIALALDPLPTGAPAVIAYRSTWPESTSTLTLALLDELERAARTLFPAWLPEAAGITGPGGAGVAAVRAIAFASAAESAHFGPFLADLAEAALRARRTREGSFAPVVRAEGLARVLADAYRRSHVTLLVDVPDDLTPAADNALAASMEWITPHGFAVWLTGAPLTTTDRFETVRVDLPAHLTQLPDIGDAAGSAPVPAPSPRPPTPARTPDLLHYPPLAGQPHPGSAAERVMEARLRTCDWAVGRAWNQTYQSHLLARQFRLDLWWAAERCVVEIDGPEHWTAVHYADDRRRDVHLQLDGCAVLRFTNADVLDDLPTVVAQIERFIRRRREDMGVTT